MNKQQEALKLALEALEVATTPLARDRQEVLRAQAAIREALAEQPAQGCGYCNHPQYAGTKCKNCGREQPAQQQQDYWQEEARRYAQNAEFWRGKYEAAIAQHQEPVAWITKNGKGWLRWHRSEDSDKNQDSIPLYTSPPASKPLTDKQIDECWYQSGGLSMRFARAIEAAHGIKGDA